jgi:hypothetical protein
VAGLGPLLVTWSLVLVAGVLAVDGQVVATNQGPKGALCSIRNW